MAMGTPGNWQWPAFRAPRIVLVVAASLLLCSIELHGAPGAPSVMADSEATGSISGHVYEAVGGTPVANANVDIQIYGPNETVVGVRTDAQGFYRADGLEPRSDYKVQVSAGGYLRAFHPQSATWELAPTVSVADGQVKNDIDIQIHKANAYIEGRVTYPDGSPVANVWMEAFHDTDQWFVGVSGDANGEYRSPVIAGTWTIFPHHPPYLEEHRQVTLQEGETISNVDFQLVLGGSVAGSVHEADGVTPVANACIQAYDSVSPLNQVSGYCCTAPDGSYTAPGIPAGPVYIKIAPNCHGDHPGLAEEWYASEGSTPDRNKATPVIVTAGDTTVGVDFELDQASSIAGSISGHVFKADATTVIDDAQISIHAHGISSGSSSVGTNVSQTDGSYMISGLAPGSYKVEVNNNRDPGYQTKYYDEKGAFQNADIILVAAGETRHDIDFRLEENASTDIDAGGGTLEHTSADGATTTVQVPANAVTETLSLVYEPKGEYPAPEDGRTTGPSFRLTVQDDDGPVEGFTFLEPITIQVEYTDEDLVYTDEDELLLYLYVYETNSWVDAATTCDPPSEYTRRPEQNTIAVDICHLSYFGVFGPDEAEYTRLPELKAE